MRLRIKNYLHGPYFVGDEKIVGPVPAERKWFPNDILNAEHKTVERTAPQPLNAVLDLLNRTGQGFNARGVPLYLCYPLDCAWPPFLVSYKNRGDTNLLVTIQYEHWHSGRWPCGGILKIHGRVGDTDCERRLLTETYYSSREKVFEIPPIIDSVLSNHKHDEWDYVFNIDPTGCEDVDDIFAWRSRGSTTTFMIGIADVSSYVPAGTDIDIRAREIGQSLYDNGAVITSMLPPLISTRLASLRHDSVDRPVIGLVFVIKDGVVTSTTWQKHILKLTHSFDYNNVFSDSYISATLLDLLTIVCGNTFDRADSHTWVAAAMINYNHTAAKLLRSVRLGVLRTHNGSSNEIYKEISTKSGIVEIASLGNTAGSYVSGSALEVGHNGLGLDVYCHVSSPLRRYVDLINQRMLKCLVFGDNLVGSYELDKNTEDLNDRARAAKNIERELLFLNIIRSDTITEVEGVALKICDATIRRWSVYIPVWKRKINGCADDVLNPGDRLIVRAYCDLRRPAWHDRIVCQLIKKN